MGKVVSKKVIDLALRSLGNKKIPEITVSASVFEVETIIALTEETFNERTESLKTISGTLIVLDLSIFVRVTLTKKEKDREEKTEEIAVNDWVCLTFVALNSLESVFSESQKIMIIITS